VKRSWAAIDPLKPGDRTCLRHGKLMSEHTCIYCVICFEDLRPEQCFIDHFGTRWNLCLACEKEAAIAYNSVEPPDIERI
jgi:uncharacterized protein (DUF2237 family)